jgi:benzoate membrane transport protein
LAALVIGTMAVVATGGLRLTAPVSLALASPLVHAPAFSLQALVELVVPLAITVVAIQNGQGIAVLTTAGYKPPINTLTTICGVGSLVYALFGSVPTCVTGPVNAILTSSGERQTNYIGGIVFGLLMLLFGVFSPTATRFALALPLAFIGLVGGLALLRVLQGAFNAAFSGQFQLGALVSLVVTFSDMKLFNIGAAFWGLVFGFLMSCLLERQAFRALRAGDQSG